MPNPGHYPSVGRLSSGLTRLSALISSEDRAHFELITPRIYELGGEIPRDIREFADRAGCPDAYLPAQATAANILQEEIEHEAWFIELPSMERDHVSRPSGHFRRGDPGEAPYSKDRGFYNP